MSGAVPPPAARPLERVARVPRPVCPGCGWCGPGDPAPAPQRAPLRAGFAGCGGGGSASPAGGAFHHCEGRLVSGAVPPQAARPLERAARVLRPGVPGAVGAGVGTQHRPHSVRPCGPALLAVEVAEGRPRGGCLPPLSGASEVRRCPSPDCPPAGRAVGVRHLRAGGGGLPPLWGAPGVRSCPSPGRPSSGAGSQGSAIRCPGCSRCGRGDPAAAPHRAPLRAGVARCWGGGRASPGGVPSTIVRGV